MTSIAGKVGCTTETLRRWLSVTVIGSRRLEREVKELCRANEILRKASACSAQAELDRHGKW